MSVSGVDTNSASLSLIDLLGNTGDTSNSILDTSATFASSSNTLSTLQNKRAQSAYGNSGRASSAVGQAALNKALAELGGGRVTFNDIAAHRAELEAQFSASVRVDLLALGVDPELEFTINMDASGTITVDCADPVAKETIQEYLADNPEVCEQFGYIQALGNLERARQGPLAGTVSWQMVNDAKAELQSQAIELFFSESLENGMDYTAMLATFNSSLSGSNETSFYAGLGFKV